MKVVRYMRVWTEGCGLQAQHKAIADEVAPRGGEVQYFADEGRSGKDMNRPGVTLAVALLEAGQAEALVVSKPTPTGGLVVNVMGAVAQWARRMTAHKRERAWPLLSRRL